jgi:hypothetical protein
VCITFGKLLLLGRGWLRGGEAKWTWPLEAFGEVCTWRGLFTGTGAAGERGPPPLVTTGAGGGFCTSACGGDKGAAAGLFCWSLKIYQKTLKSENLMHMLI